MRKAGLDINRPIDPGTGAINPTVNPDLAGQVAWVRVNFVLGPWPSPDHAAWRATYDDIVNRYLARGIQVYGHIGHEAVTDPGLIFQADHPQPEPPEAQAWIEAYVRHFVSIVDHFRGRVRRFESFNEPNNWRQGRPFVSPYWFAKMIGAIYRAVKLEGGFDDVTLISGPLLSHNNNDEENEISIGWRYLQDTFRAGKAVHGWEAIRAAAGSYPLDGIGYHLYVDQGRDKTPDAIAGTVRHYLDAIFRVLTQEDDRAAEKKIYVSEFGWQSHVVGDQKQAENLQVAFDVLRNDPRVGVAIWFSTQDFPDKEQPEGWNRFGLFRETGLGPADVKPAHRALQDVASAEPAVEPGEPVIPLADGFQFPVGRAGRDVLDDFYVATFFMDPTYHQEWNAWHPGEDWNGRGGGDTDLGEPVYAVAHGRVVASDHYTPSWGNVVLVEHQLPDGRRIWSQYAHLQDRLVAAGDVVSRGQQIGSIGKGDQDRWPAHLHFEVRTRDLAPDTWFPLVRDADQVKTHYTNPSAFIRSHLAGEFAYQPPRVGQEIILDTENSDPAAGVFRKAKVPSWWSAPYGFRGSTLWTYAAREQLANWGEWRPILPEAGRYEIFVFVPRNFATTRSARYQVNHLDDRTEVVVDQSRYFDQWVSLGTFACAAGTSSYLRLTDVTGEPWSQRRQVAFDAARWVRILEA
jgi:murein DD-endopeptidase MepM/ murein hydrolase activator NlpD